jgi:nucleoside-diphosphate-sugar epimerase
LLKNNRILITGPASQATFPIARELARSNTVYGLARWSNPDDRKKVEAVGIETLAADLADDALDHLPDGLDYVLNFANVKTGSFDYDLRANVEGVGRLMSRCRDARAFLYCSSTAVYEANGRHAFSESDPLGDNHRALFATYSIGKIAAESMVRFCAREFELPSIICRLNVPYGDNGGWPGFHLEMMAAGMEIPLHSSDGPCLYSPIHEDDYTATIPALLGAASVPATTVNWCGDETVGIEDWCNYMGELTGLEARFTRSDATLESVVTDPARLNEITGPRPTVGWKDGIKRMVAALHPELLA